MRTISDEQKIYELSKIWKDAEYNFAFWDRVSVDWDGEYKKALPRGALFSIRGLTAPSRRGMIKPTSSEREGSLNGK